MGDEVVVVVVPLRARVWARKVAAPVAYRVNRAVS